jgi:hypothetical protein
VTRLLSSSVSLAGEPKATQLRLDKVEKPSMNSRTFLPICTILIGVVSLLSLTNCSTKLPNISAPDYLQEKIQQSPPSDPLTLYRLKGPYGGHSVCLAAHGNTIILGTEKGEIYRSKADKIEWILSKTESNRNRAYAIVPMGNRLFAATGNGILQSVDEGLTWQSLTKKIVTRELYVFQDSLLVDDTWKVLRFDLKTNEASSLNIPKSEEKPSESVFVRSLATANNHVFLVSSTHLFRSSDLVTWSTVDDGLGLSSNRSSKDKTSVTQVEINANNIFALVSSDRDFKIPYRLFVSQDLGKHWNQIPTPSGLNYHARLVNTPQGSS